MTKTVIEHVLSRLRDIGITFYGRLPDGQWKFRSAYNGCPPGSWVGPWGHCRDTPYHGRLPNGRWK